jgi:transaldolase/glucose-6-phosphate isomerase
MDPLRALQRHGQSIWLDYIRRSLITSGELKRLVTEDGVSGVTINPTILEKAIAGSEDYNDALAELLRDDPHMDTRLLYEKLAVEDVQMAADILRPVYDRTGGADGFVSLELSPRLANDTEGSIKEAHHFWRLVNRPNVMLKVPATPEGIPVIETLIAEGINVNVTLMFSLSHYEAVANAYIGGLERSEDPSKVASVASFFVSRVDSIVDKALEEKGSPKALKLRGKIGIANSKLVYKRFREIFSGERWEKLAKRGAKVQRPLWASTSTKNPEYRDVIYVEELIGENTVNTLPPDTLNAFRDHGRVGLTLMRGVKEAEEYIKSLGDIGIDLNMLTEKLQVESVLKFSDSHDKLLSSLDEKRNTILYGEVQRLSLKIGRFQASVDKRLRSWKAIHFNRRLWEKDPTIWFKKPTPGLIDRLGWLNLPSAMHEELDSLVSFAEEVKKEGIRHIVLMGEGGSSLAAEVFQAVFGSAQGYPELVVLDSTHPDSVRAVEEKIELHNTLFILASKSGTTLEPLAFFRYFWEKMRGEVDNPGNHFIAITDPETPLVGLAQRKEFRRIFLAPPDLGGRYSALTVFGMVPAALIGVRVHKLLDRAWVAAEACAFCVAEQKTPGLALGAALGELAISGRNKVTFLCSPSINSFPHWLEQLIAESTGKDGKGIIPILDEPTTDVVSYGDDRFFVYFAMEGDQNGELEKKVMELETMGHPIARINLLGKYDIGMEIFRWEIAVAAAGSILGVHPFDQPDVELAKELTRAAMEKGHNVESSGVETVSSEDPAELGKALKDWLGMACARDYVAIQAYLPRSDEINKALGEIRDIILNRLHLATTLGYGPRFLHSTGQLHKGGPNNGLFLQLVDKPRHDLGVPKTGYTFGEMIRAQALGDYQALRKRGRRVLRVDLRKDVPGGLSRLVGLLRSNG